MSSTYNLADAVGQVRFYASDTDIDESLFEDNEITFALSKNGNDPQLAAASLLEVLAGHRARIAATIKTGSVTRDLGEVAKNLLEVATRLRTQASSSMTYEQMYAGCAGIAPDPVFTPTAGYGEFPGSMEGW